MKATAIVLHSIERQICQVLSSEHPAFIRRILYFLSTSCGSDKTIGIALRVLSLLSNSGEAMLGQQHPLRRIFECLQRIVSSDLAKTTIRCQQLIADRFKDNLGAMHVDSLLARMNIASIGTLKALLQKCQTELDIDDYRTRYVHYRLAEQFHEEDQYNIACDACHEIIEITFQMQGTDGEQVSYHAGFYRALSLHHLARCQRMLYQDRESEANMREAIALRISYFGSWDCQARSWIPRLRRWLIKDHRAQEAAEAWQWWNMIANPPAALENFESHALVSF